MTISELGNSPRPQEKFSFRFSLNEVSYDLAPIRDIPLDQGFCDGETFENFESEQTFDLENSPLNRGFCDGEIIGNCDSEQIFDLTRIADLYENLTPFILQKIKEIDEDIRADLVKEVDELTELENGTIELIASNVQVEINRQCLETLQKSLAEKRSLLQNGSYKLQIGYCNCCKDNHVNHQTICDLVYFQKLIYNLNEFWIENQAMTCGLSAPISDGIRDKVVSVLHCLEQTINIVGTSKELE